MSIFKTIFKTTKKINVIKMLKKSTLPGVGLSFILATCFNNSVWASAKKTDDYALLNGLESKGDLGSTSSTFPLCGSKDDGATSSGTWPVGHCLQDQYEESAPTLQQWPSYEVGGFDCRSLIGSSTTQSYQLVTNIFPDSPSFDSSIPAGGLAKATGFSVADPDHDYKACLIYQLISMNQRRESNNQNPFDYNFSSNNLPWQSTRLIPSELLSHPSDSNNGYWNGVGALLDPSAPIGSTNPSDRKYFNIQVNDSPAGENDGGVKANNDPNTYMCLSTTLNDKQITISHASYMEIKDKYHKLSWHSAPCPATKDKDDWVKLVYYPLISQQAWILKNSLVTTSGTHAADPSNTNLIANSPNGVPTLNPSFFLNNPISTPFTGIYSSGGKKWSCNQDPSGCRAWNETIAHNDKVFNFWNFDSKDPTPWLAMEDYLGYGPNLSMMSQYLDRGSLFNNGGMLNLPMAGSIQVGNHDKGTLVTKSTITLNHVTRQEFSDVVTSGEKLLDGVNTALDVVNWNTTGNTPDWSNFVTNVLNSGIAKVTKGVNTVVGYLPGSGYYKGSIDGMLVESTGVDGNFHPAWSSDLARAGKVTSSGLAYDMCNILLGAPLPYSKESSGVCMINHNSRGWRISYKGHGHALGVPLCGWPKKLVDGKLENMTFTTGVTNSGTANPPKPGVFRYDMLTNPSLYPSGRVPDQPFGNINCAILYNDGNIGRDNDSQDGYPLLSKVIGESGSSTGKEPKGYPFHFNSPSAIFGGPDSDVSVSWWRIGESYLIVNKLLSQNVQKLVDAINQVLTQDKITEALTKLKAPFSNTSGSFTVNVSQKLSFNMNFSGGINGELSLTYVPQTAVAGIMNPLSKPSESLSTAFSLNTLLLAVENQDLTTSTEGTTSLKDSLPEDTKHLVSRIQSLPSSLLRPLEYYALFYRVVYNKSSYEKKLDSADYSKFKSQLKHMTDALVQNGLANDDIKGGPGNTASMYSSISSSLGTIYQHITPSQVNGAGSSSTFINPINLENDLQSIYEFGGSSGDISKDPHKMIGKQYDFLTQIQQLGVHMIGDVVDNLYQIGDSYTNTFNNNTALINDNLSSSQAIVGAVQTYNRKAQLQVNGIETYKQSESDTFMQKEKALTDKMKSDMPGQGGIGGTAWFNDLGNSVSGLFGYHHDKNAIDMANVNFDKAQLDSVQALENQKLQQYALNNGKIQLALTRSGIQSTNMMLNVQHKQLELSQMSYQMMVNMTKSMMLLPLAFVVLTMLFTSGMQFALIIPMTPYIIFWAGQTSWIINCIEAMVAAPLVGLALLHPGGHAFYGHTIQAYKMLINVILKPVLLVFGTIASMVLVYIIVVYSAQGFHMMANSVVGTFISFHYGQNADGTYANLDRETNVRAVLSLMLIFMYSTFLVMVFNKCFSVIYVIPEKVVGWVGGQADNFGKEASQHLAQATQQETGQVAQAGQQSTQSIAGGSKEMSSAKGQSAQSQGGTGVQMAGSSEKNTSATSSEAGQTSQNNSSSEGAAKSQGDSDSAQEQGQANQHNAEANANKFDAQALITTAMSVGGAAAG